MKTILLFFITIFITVWALACFGCTSQAIDDAGISTKIKGKLAADSETSAIQIGVDTIDRVVTLSGVVPSDREKVKAEQLARNTEGVAQVVNNLTVNPGMVDTTNAGEKAETAVTDAAILAKIKAKMLTEGITGTNVDVVNGEVSITGEVDSAQRVTQATDIARSTNGVKSVNNRLTVKRP